MVLKSNHSTKKYEVKKDKTKRDDAQPTRSQIDIATLLLEHIMTLSSKFKSVFASLDVKLDTLHTTE